MKNLNITLKAAVLCCAFLASTIAFAQTVITIDNNPGSTTTYQTIQEAHDAASSGDIIYVQPSNVNYGNLIIQKPITIVGRSHSEPGQRSEIGSVSLRSGGITIKGLYTNSISSSTSSTATTPFVAIDIFECSISSLSIGTLTSNTTTNYDDVAIIGNYIRGGLVLLGDSGDVIVSNNVIGGNDPIQTYNTVGAIFTNNIFRSSQNVMRFYNYTASGTAILANNMFIFNFGSDGQIIFQNGIWGLANNLSYNYGTASTTLLEASSGTFDDNGSTISNTNPQFTNVDASISQSFAGTSTYDPLFRPEDDLTLQAGSPALTGGTGGSEIGLYNNGFNYSIFGNPRNIPILDIESSDAAVQAGSNINVIVTAKAN